MSISKIVKLKSSNFLPLLLVFVVALWSVWPVLGNFTNSLTHGHEDLLIVWILNQTIQKIPQDLGNIFQGNIFYPNVDVMAYSDLLVPSAILSWLPVYLTKQPVVAYNFSLIFGQVLTMLVIYFWFKEMTKSKWAAFLGASALGLSQIRMHYYVHLQMWNMQWWLVSAWMIWKYRNTSKLKYLYIAGLFVVIQVWESLLPVFWIGAFGLILIWPRLKFLMKDWKHVLAISVIVVVLTLPVTNAYLGVSRRFDYQRSIRDTAHFSMSIENLWGEFLSPGLYILLFASFLSFDKKKLLHDITLRWMLVAVFLGLIMSFGPVVKINNQTFKIANIPIPLPYSLAYYLVPGFGALRTPSRWIWPSAFAASGIIAYGFSRYKSKKLLYLVFPAILLAILGGTRIQNNIQIPKVENYSRVYKYLKTLPEEAVLELPIYTWGAGIDVIVEEMYRMLYSLDHKKQRVNGYSGFYPPEWERLVADLTTDFPNTALEKRLIERGVNYVIVHKRQYEAEKLLSIEEWGEDKLIWQDLETMVFEL
jgi:hypothetical protein